jgi:hypothetical protein
VTTILRFWPRAVWLAVVLVLLGVIAFGYIVNGEEICLDRHPWWGPPKDPNVYTSCSGHWYERHHKL